MALLLVPLMVIGLAGLIAGQSKPCPYAEYVGPNEMHIMCLPPNSSCRIVNAGVSVADRNLIVKLHNDIRNKVASGQQTVANGVRLPQAADMRLLVWSPELAAIAQAHANQCLTTFECSNCRSTDDYTTGENLFYFYNQNQTPRTQWQQVISQWAAGARRLTSVKYYPNRPGSFTQMIWGLTKDIGCGRAMFRGNPRTARYIDLYVCMYGPSGNYVNTDVYEVGRPCSDCAYGESCPARGTTMQYPNLCETPRTGA